MLPVLQLMRHAVDNSDFIDNSAYKYMEIIPEFLFERNYYSKEVFEDITEAEYNVFVKILNDQDADLNTIMKYVYDIAMEYVYTVITKRSRETYGYLKTVIEIMKKNRLPLPDINTVSAYSFDEFDGWGDFIDPKSLSAMLPKE